MERVEFVDKAHEDRFHQYMAQINRAGEPLKQLPSELVPAVYLLASSVDLGIRSIKYFNGAHEWYWREMLEREVLSSGERWMLQLASALWTGAECLVSGLWDTIDSQNYQVAMAAIRIRRLGRQCLISWHV